MGDASFFLARFEAVVPIYWVLVILYPLFQINIGNLHKSNRASETRQATSGVAHRITEGVLWMMR